MGVAESLYREFVEGGVARVKRAAVENEPESRHLDFKESGTRTGAMTGDDRKNLGKNLSGFANSNGGVLVWGVEAKGTSKDPQRRAIEPRPIPNIDRFLDDLNSAIGDVVERAVAGVENAKIRLPDGSGYAVTLVPESDARPHMSMASDDRRYYRRNGSQTQALDHVMVEALMQSRRRARLEVFVDGVSENRMVAGGTERRTCLAVRNVGDAPARDVVITLLSNQGRTHRGGLDLATGSIVKVRCQDGIDRHAEQFFTAPGRVLYPGMTFHVIEVVQTDPHTFGNDGISWSVYSDTYNESGTLGTGGKR